MEKRRMIGAIIVGMATFIGVLFITGDEYLVGTIIILIGLVGNFIIQTPKVDTKKLDTPKPVEDMRR